MASNSVSLNPARLAQSAVSAWRLEVIQAPSNPKKSKQLHRRSHGQRGGISRQGPIEGDKPAAALAAQQVQSIREVQTAAMSIKGLAHQLFLLHMHMTDPHR